jgi:hypothetical protein
MYNGRKGAPIPSAPKFHDFLEKVHDKPGKSAESRVRLSDGTVNGRRFTCGDWHLLGVALVIRTRSAELCCDPRGATSAFTRLDTL